MKTTVSFRHQHHFLELAFRGSFNNALKKLFSLHLQHNRFIAIYIMLSSWPYYIVMRASCSKSTHNHLTSLPNSNFTCLSTLFFLLQRREAFPLRQSPPHKSGGPCRPHKAGGDAPPAPHPWQVPTEGEEERGERAEGSRAQCRDTESHQ